MIPGWIFRHHGPTAEAAVSRTVQEIASGYEHHHVRAIVRKIEQDPYGIYLDYPFWECIIELPIINPLYEDGLRSVFEAARKLVGERDGCHYDAIVQKLNAMAETVLP